MSKTFVKKSLGFALTRRKKISDARLIYSTYLRNKNRIDEGLSGYGSVILGKRSPYQIFKELATENMYKEEYDAEGNLSKRTKIKSARDSLNELALSNYFSSQEERGMFGWTQAFKSEAPELWKQFVVSELQKGGHEKFDPTRWHYLKDQSSKNMQLYAYYPKKKGKAPILVSLRNSPKDWSIMKPKEGNEWYLNSEGLVLERKKVIKNAKRTS